MKDLIKRLDKIANTIENRGYIKEAMELDIIANTLEAFDENTSRPGQILREIIEALYSGNLVKAKGLFSNNKLLFENLVNNYSDRTLPNNKIPAKDFQNSYQKALSMIEQQDREGAIQAVQEAFQNLRALAPIIRNYFNRDQSTIQKMQENIPPSNTPQRRPLEEMSFGPGPRKGLFQKIFK